MKTYTISEELYIAIIEHAYIKGVGNGYDTAKNPLVPLKDDKEAVQNALETIRNQQYIYED